MWILITAVLTASLLGSMHCVGMCGPLAIWASGTGQTTSRRTLALSTTLYHLGRLVTYALAGLIAGGLGQLVDVGGQALGVQLVAARIAGGLMIVIGGFRLWQLWQLRRGMRSVKTMNNNPSPISGVLVRLRPLVFRLPIASRGLATGLLTAFLPCGWLYLFALVAAGTGSLVMGPVVMAAFWLGSVPALVGLVASSAALATRFRTVVPVAAAVLLIVGGFYTAAGRGFAKLNSLADIRATSLSAEDTGSQLAPSAAAIAKMSASDKASQLVNSMDELLTTPLPCCVESDSGATP